ncbi:MAG: SpaA isopeptide-forming pilin-related protein [Thomasclavelia ramosa]
MNNGYQPDDAHLIKGLLVDCEYVLKEVKAPAGYTLAPELTFKVRTVRV